MDVFVQLLIFLKRVQPPFDIIDYW